MLVHNMLTVRQSNMKGLRLKNKHIRGLLRGLLRSSWITSLNHSVIYYYTGKLNQHFDFSTSAIFLTNTVAHTEKLITSLRIIWAWMPHLNSNWKVNPGCKPPAPAVHTCLTT